MDTNSEERWEEASGFDSDGLRIKDDLALMQNGKFDNDEIGELVADLVRDGRVSSAAILALPILTSELSQLSEMSRLQCVYAACLIMGLDGASGHKRTSDRVALQDRAVKSLLAQASTLSLADEWLVAIAGVLLLLAGKEGAYRRLIDMDI